jgi:hypothetical protein
VSRNRDAVHEHGTYIVVAGALDDRCGPRRRPIRQWGPVVSSTTRSARWPTSIDPISAPRPIAVAPSMVTRPNIAAGPTGSPATQLNW